MSRWKRSLFYSMVVCLLLLTMHMARRPLLTSMGSWLDVGRSPSHCDYVMILGGGPDTRPYAASAMMKAGYASNALIPTVLATADVDDGFALDSHEIYRRVLVSRGVAATHIEVLDIDATSTLDEARALRRFLMSMPDVRVSIVTDDFHTRRARWIFHRILGPRREQVQFVAAPADGLAADNWWQSRLLTTTAAMVGGCTGWQAFSC
jgi:uncharacterized SAM-binding protein YcdF (DUF218 family)